MKYFRKKRTQSARGRESFGNYVGKLYSSPQISCPRTGVTERELRRAPYTSVSEGYRRCGNVAPRLSGALLKGARKMSEPLSPRGWRFFSRKEGCSKKPRDWGEFFHIFVHQKFFKIASLPAKLCSIHYSTPSLGFPGHNQNRRRLIAARLPGEKY